MIIIIWAKLWSNPKWSHLILPTVVRNFSIRCHHNRIWCWFKNRPHRCHLHVKWADFWVCNQWQLSSCKPHWHQRFHAGLCYRKPESNCHQRQRKWKTSHQFLFVSWVGIIKYFLIPYHFGIFLLFNETSGFVPSSKQNYKKQ